MERNRTQPGTTADASGGISANQRAQVTTFDNASIQIPRNNVTLALHPSYPLTTTHYGQCVYLAEYQSDSSANTNATGSYPTRTTPFPNRRASPSMLHQNLASPSPVPNVIPKEDYERAVQQNTRLTLELEAAEESIEKATKACRDLAAWSYWERERLMCELEEVKRELAEVKGAHRAFINDEVDQLIAEEAGRLPSY